MAYTSILQVKESLKKEVMATLFWLAKTDLDIYDTIKDGVKDSFETQGVYFPANLVGNLDIMKAISGINSNDWGELGIQCEKACQRLGLKPTMKNKEFLLCLSNS